MEIKHSIIIICYNQEKFIKSALDSLLLEEIKPFEIIIGDDCSSDETRDILIDYKNKHPNIIKLVFNENNLGIFSNLNNVAFMATGDVISFLAGDDFFKPKFIENMNKTILQLGLNPKIMKFALLPNIVLYSNGVENILSNNEVLLKKYSPTGLLLRGAIHTTNAGLSRAFYNDWPAYPEDSSKIGPWVDFLHHMLHMQHCEKLIIMNCSGPVYRVGVGIASRTGSKELANSFYRAIVRVQQSHLSGQLLLDRVDQEYLAFLIASWNASLYASPASYFSLFRAAYRLLILDPSEFNFIIKELTQSIRRTLSGCIKKMLSIST